MSTERLYESDSLLMRCTARVTAVTEVGFATDQTVFYARGGGQPGDRGEAIVNGQAIPVTGTVKGEAGAIIHILADVAAAPEPGTEIELILDADRRIRLMRMHTALHLLCSLIDAPVTGGSIDEDKARLDFDLEENPDKDQLTRALNNLMRAGHPVTISTITGAELDANPELVRTMSVQPPRGTSGEIRMVQIGAAGAVVDYQPCGGTHVISTSEIGPLRVEKIVKKGRQNRRISLTFA